METFKGLLTVPAKNSKEWREWLQNNHIKEKRIWLILYNKSSDVLSITWSEAVDEALCFGWIDSTVYKRDAESRYQLYTPRKPKSFWSRINKEKIEKLIAEGRMTDAGLRMVELAKQTGTWAALDDVENLIVPDDLQEAFNRYPQAAQNFDAFPKSAKKMILTWIFSAKTPATRQKQLEETAEKAAKNIRSKLA